MEGEKSSQSQWSTLARHFVCHYGQLAGKRLPHDNRVFFTPRVVDAVATKPHRAVRMRWSLSLQRIIDIGNAENPDQAVVDSTVVLHRGSLPLEKR